MIALPVRAEEVLRGSAKVRTSFRIVDANGEYVASVLAGWGTSNDARRVRANEIVEAINSAQVIDYATQVLNRVAEKL